MRTPTAAVAGAALARAIAAPMAAQQSHAGIHIGYSFDLDEELLGAQLHLGLGRGIGLYPSFDYYLVENGSLVGLNVDLKIHGGSRGNPVYFGGGLNFLRADGGNSESGANFFVGLEGRSGRTHPYGELRLLLQNEASLLLLAGLDFTLF